MSAARPYMVTIATTTAGGSTALPAGVKILKIVNNDAANFTTLSVEAAIGTSLNPEAILLATDSVDFSNAGLTVGGNELVLYWKSNTANVNVSIFGYIS